MALAASASLASGTPHPPSGLSAPSGHAQPRLAMAEAAEKEAIRQSAAEEQARLRAPVGPSLLRVQGDSRGTASTLVGLTPEEELELAMLKSLHGDEATDPRATAAAARPHMGVSVTHPPQQPLPPPPRGTVLSNGTQKREGRTGGSGKSSGKAEHGSLKEGLLGDEYDLLAPLQIPTLPAMHAAAMPAYVPPALAPLPGPRVAQQPLADAVLVSASGDSGRRNDANDLDEEWDDADRPLRGEDVASVTPLFAPDAPGGSEQSPRVRGGRAGLPQAANSWGINTSKRYAQLD